MKNENITPICNVEIVNPEKVEEAREKLLNATQIFDVANTFKLLGEPSRLKIVFSLLSDELCVCDIAASIDSTISAVSHQLRLLRSAKLVKYRKEGKMVYYSLDDQHVDKLVNEALKHYK